MSGIEKIRRERERQLSEEGWTAKHDDEHVDEDLAWAAVCYAAPAEIRAKVYADLPCGCRSAGECFHVFGKEEWRDPWPWDVRWDKRKMKTREERLIVAGALIAAELDRLERAKRAINAFPSGT